MGIIRKIVEFENVTGDLYNLAFGDWDESLQKMDSNNRSNNQDTYLVLATVVAAVLDFTEKFQNRYIHIKGITPSRTRLFRMVINANWYEITKKLELKGLVDEEWLPFERNKNYEAVMARYK